MLRLLHAAARRGGFLGRAGFRRPPTGRRTATRGSTARTVRRNTRSPLSGMSGALQRRRLRAPHGIPARGDMHHRDRRESRRWRRGWGRSAVRSLTGRDSTPTSGRSSPLTSPGYSPRRGAGEHRGHADGIPHRAPARGRKLRADGGRRRCRYHRGGGLGPCRDGFPRGGGGCAARRGLARRIRQLLHHGREELRKHGAGGDRAFRPPGAGESAEKAAAQLEEYRREGAATPSS